MLKIYILIFPITLICCATFHENEYCSISTTLFWNIVDPIFKVTNNYINAKNSLTKTIFLETIFNNIY